MTNTEPSVKAPAKAPSAIIRVSFYKDPVGCCCDRCGTYIKNVALVSYKDGLDQRYGSECINKILSGDTTLQGLWKQNAKLLQHWQACLAILSGPEDQTPPPRWAVNDYEHVFPFISDEKGGWMTVADRPGSSYGHYLFHPIPADMTKAARIFSGAPSFDMRGMPGKTSWEPYTLENWQLLRRFEIERARVWLQSEIERIGKFLARVLAKGLVTPEGK